MVRLVLSRSCHLLTDNSLQSADIEQQKMRGVAEKPHGAVVTFDIYRNLQRWHDILFLKDVVGYILSVITV